MDIVYILGTGSICENNEIRYSIRSVEKHIKDYDKIFIVGYLPSFLKESDKLIHIPHTDEKIIPSLRSKEHNIKDKILYACSSPLLSENFLLFNDDHFLCYDFYVNVFPFMYSCSLQYKIENVARGNYYFAIKNTYNILRKNKLPLLFYDIHCPLEINKSKFIEAMDFFNWENANGYVVKSLYCNYCDVDGLLYSDCKIMSRFTNFEKLKDVIRGRAFFSMGENLSWSMVSDFMEFMYPNKSRPEL